MNPRPAAVCHFTIGFLLSVLLLSAASIPTALAADSSTTLRDEFWGYSFVHHGIPTTDTFGYQEVVVFRASFDPETVREGGLSVSQRLLSGEGSEEHFDRLVPLMDADGDSLLGQKQNIIIGGMPSVWATFRNFETKEMTIHAFTKAPPGERSWWFHGSVKAERPALAMGAIRQAILNFKALNPGETPTAEPDSYVLPGKFQIKTTGFAKMDGTLKFDAAERAVEAPLEAGGGRAATITLQALRVPADRPALLQELRDDAKEKKQTIVEEKETTVSGRAAVHMTVKGPPNETVTQTLCVWDGDLLWKLTASEDTTKQKSPLLRKFFVDALNSFTLLHEPAK